MKGGVKVIVYSKILLGQSAVLSLTCNIRQDQNSLCSVHFIASANAAGLPQRTPASEQTSSDSCRAQGHHKTGTFLMKSLDGFS
jgi:hypothetical protein